MTAGSGTPVAVMSDWLFTRAFVVLVPFPCYNYNYTQYSSRVHKRDGGPAISESQTDGIRLHARAPGSKLERPVALELRWKNCMTVDFGGLKCA